MYIYLNNNLKVMWDLYGAQVTIGGTPGNDGTIQREPFQCMTKTAGYFPRLVTVIAIHITEDYPSYIGSDLT